MLGVEYVYDTLGRRTEMHTYQSTPSGGWAGSTWPGSPPTPQVTAWVYQYER